VPLGRDRLTAAADAIFDTNSGGRFDQVIYEDGLLAVKATYTGNLPDDCSPTACSAPQRR
jgi:hypothetical protein